MANTFLADSPTADPEPHTSEDGHDCAAFTVVVNRRHQVNGKWENASSSFHRCMVWGDQARRVLDDLHKGSRVVLTGELRTRTYKDKSGTSHITTMVWVDEIGPSLRFDDAAADHGHGSHHDDV